MNINYIILAHQNPTQVGRLVNALNVKNTFFYIHIDKKSQIEPFLKEVNHFENVYFFNEDRVNVIWGDISQVEATLLSISKIISDGRDGYTVLMSGQDYPIKSNKYIFEFFLKNYGKNFIRSKPIEEVWKEKSVFYRVHKYTFHLIDTMRTRTSIVDIYNKEFFSIPNLKSLAKVLISKERRHAFNIFFIRKFPESMKAYGGNQWWAFPIETIKYIDGFVEKNKFYLEYHKFTHIPDEIFFQSIISNYFDENAIKDTITFVDWSAKNRPLPVTFNSSDLEDLKAKKDHLFARKFNGDTQILDEIDSYLLDQLDLK
ncbi:beta-1,6-N-acetylglucosaminyltransferase [Lutibacter sp.]|uniref:beta-1,6-N-acetylglucosaminyltransferase n=1 Tax=Lutibacter sp. TaxID=1925666 RepID=UPI0027366500|nr:beta-1,6-N-acetylglucosaminyltransferase [Lutibacter sp.]MDP3312590.1 beta-1,6-N-acetylglucosaminyltransferase [Lutibacter sp.]